MDKKTYNQEYARRVGYAPQRKYAAQNNKQIGFVLNKNTDNDILEYLQTIDSVNGYLKTLIRADIAQNAQK